MSSGRQRSRAPAGALLIFLLIAAAWLSAPSALAAPLPGSSYDSQDGNQLTNTSPAALDWQNVAPQAFLSTSLDNQANDGCFSGGIENQPNGWTFTNVPGGCTTPKADLLGMWTHGEITPTRNYLHGAFVRRAGSGNTFATFELNQSATTWVNAMGTTIPCRSTGDILIGYDLQGTAIDVTFYRWTGDGSGPPSCPNGAAGNFQATSAVNNGSVNTATIANFLSPSAINAALGRSDSNIPGGLFGEAQIEIGPVLQSFGVTGCFSFVSVQAHSRSSQSFASTLVDYIPSVPTQVANCAVTGTVWSDLDNDGTRDSGEGGAAGRTAFVDVNDNGALDANEPNDATDSQGFYFIPTNLTAGSYKVRVIVPPNSLCTSPVSCSHTSTFTATGTNTVQNDFGIYFFTPPQNTWAPSISGSVQEGSTLTADRGLWNGTEPISYAYQWLRCDAAGANCVNIAGATSQTYVSAPADVGSTIRVRVTGTNMMGSSSAVSLQTGSVTPRPPVNTGTPTISGTPQEASTLTASPGTWSGTAPINFAYRWRRCDSSGANCTDIGGATNQTYNLVVADIGSTIRVRVTATNVTGTPVTADSAQTAQVTGRIPVNNTLPATSGATQEASTLTASPGTWTGTLPISFSYQWQRCDAAGTNCTDIGGETNQTYALVPADVGSRIRISVTATNVAGNTSAQSNPTAVITARIPATDGTPTISGNPQEGSTLTADPGTWTGTQPITFAYQWRRCNFEGINCVDISGATNQTYDLVPDDVGNTIRVRVTATNASGTPVNAQSAETDVIAGRGALNTGLPTISGDPLEGSTLTAHPGFWEGTQPIDFAYQWLRCDPVGLNCAVIDGETADTHMVVLADVGNTLRVRVTATNITGNSVAVSAPTSLTYARPPVNVGTPLIFGNPQEGSTLTADPGNWTGTDPIDHAYQWLRCDSAGAGCSDIGGATNQTYDLVPVDIGSTIRVRVTASNAANTPVSAESEQTVEITGRAPVNTGLPTISGNPEEGSTLTADPGTWEGTQPIDLTYDWERCDGDGDDCVDIGGATNQTYDLVPADVGSTVRVRVTATNVAGLETERASATVLIPARVPVNSGTPTISGNPEEASTLTADPGTWTGTQPIDFAYQWLRCDSAGANCSDIGGATNQTYDLVPADVGSTIRIRVTATNLSGTPVSADSAQTAQISGRPPVNATLPAISGNKQENSTLTATGGTWTGTQPINLAYQWQRCDSAGANCADIGGATAQTYHLVPADVGQRIRIQVTATNIAGSASANSSVTIAITARVPVNSGTPTISGNPQEASTLTANPGTWTGTQPISFAYQWRRCDASGANCTDIASATAQSYALVPADIGYTIRIRVTATNISGTPVAAQSAQTVVISGRVPVNTQLPTISGNPQEGSTLTATDGLWTGTAPISFAYQWLRCDAAGSNCADIGGATNQTYDLVPADVGSTVRIAVTATNIAGSDTAASSLTIAIPARIPASTGTPTISGTPQEASTLTADPGTWTGTQPISFAYQWRRCDAAGANCADIGSATNQSYGLVPADIGSTIRIRVTATNISGTPVSADSAETAQISGRNPVNTAPPVITGNPQEDSTLSATGGTWTGTQPINLAFQWQRCDSAGANCADIGGATAQTYHLVPADVGQTIRFRVTASNIVGSATANSIVTIAITARIPANTGTPTISGSPIEGSSLTADPGTWTGTQPISFAYQWLRCDATGANCTDVAGATAQSYALVPVDIGSTMRIRVTATNAGATPVAVQSAQTAVIAGRAPVNTQLPAISGQTLEGSTLTTDQGTWTGTAPISFAYQWLRCNQAGNSCQDISGATAQSYLIVPADANRTIRVRVTATNITGQVSVESAATASVGIRAPVVDLYPSISGTPQEGSTLTADPGIWTGTQPITFAYQWRRCNAAGSNCSDIGGATAQTHALVPADVGSTIRIRVTATNISGTPVSADSAETAQISGRAPVNTAPPAISGTPQEGSTLTADPGTWTGTQPINITYQWLRCDSAGANCANIGGSTGQTHNLVPADFGSTVAVRVTATNIAGSANQQTSVTPVIDARAPVNSGTPTITGNPQEASTLTAHPGTWTGTQPITFAYQWLRCDPAGANCTDIGGATNLTYDIVPADIALTLRVRVTATNISGSPVSAQSAPTSQVTGRAPVNTVLPAVSGNAMEGSTLTADSGTWTGTDPIGYSYQWRRCDNAGANCTDIGGQTAQTYMVVAADSDLTLRVRVTASNVAGSDFADSVVTTPIGTRPPVNDAVPTISGTPEEASTLTADPGSWDGTQPIDFDYQWLRCDTAGANCSDIGGAANQTYDLVPADVGSTIRVRVTATNISGTPVSAESAETAEVTGRLPVNATAPTITGNAREGSTLTAHPGSWTGTQPIDFEYQWLRCDTAGANCSDIGGATSQTYGVDLADIGSTIRVNVTASNVAGSASAQSPATAVASGRPPVSTSPPTISGNPQVDSTLTADPGTWDGTGPIDFEYQWLRCDANGCTPIQGATDDTYVPTADDIGFQIRVEVTATNVADTVVRQSPPVGPVTPVPPANTTPPSFSGVLQVGNTLTGDPGEWSGTGPFDFAYQWLRCDAAGNNCVPIPGATGQTYVLRPGDADHTIRLSVTATNGGAGVSATSDFQGPVLSLDPPDPPGPRPGVCQRAPAPTAMSFAMRGVGIMRFRIASTGESITRATPLVAGSTKTFTRVGRLNRLLRGVVYRLDRRRIGVSRRAPYRLALPLRMLATGKRHTLTVTAFGRDGSRAKLNVPFRTAPCLTQFIANYRSNTRRGALRLRVDSKRAVRRVTFFTPSGMLPQATTRRSRGRLRVLYGDVGRSIYRLGFGRRGSRRGTILRAPGAPIVRIHGRRVTVGHLPPATGMLKLELVRRFGFIRRLTRRTTLGVHVTTAAGTEVLRVKIGPRARR